MIFIGRSNTYHDNYMSIKIEKLISILMDLSKTLQCHSIYFLSWLKWYKMNTTMSFIEVPAGRYSELRNAHWLASHLFAISVILVLLFLIRRTNIWSGSQKFWKIKKMQHHVSLFIEKCIDPYIAKMNTVHHGIMMHQCTNASSHS